MAARREGGDRHERRDARDEDHAVSDARARLDPDLLALAEAPPVAITRDMLPELRAMAGSMISGLVAAAYPLAALRPVTVTRVDLPAVTGLGPYAVLVYAPDRPAKAPRPAILHLHGGGFVLFDALSMDAANRELAHQLDGVVVSVDYHLAPENPHPGPVEEAFGALLWLDRQARALGVDRTRIGVKGESAGGGLAAGLALLARDRKGPRLAFQHLVYPMLDDRTGLKEDPGPFLGAFGWSAHNNRFGWSALLGDRAGGEGVEPYAAPARAEALKGLPPTFLSTGALDLFAAEILTFARRLVLAGVPTELHLYPGAIHGFDLTPDADVAIRCRRDSLDALARATGARPAP